MDKETRLKNLYRLKEVIKWLLDLEVKKKNSNQANIDNFLDRLNRVSTEIEALEKEK